MENIKTVCYCYNYSDDDIIRDVLFNKGRSTIEQKIGVEKAAGRCRCEIKNPKKT